MPEHPVAVRAEKPSNRSRFVAMIYVEHFVLRLGRLADRTRSRLSEQHHGVISQRDLIFSLQVPLANRVLFLFIPPLLVTRLRLPPKLVLLLSAWLASG
jgi:hypothetical protein